MQNDWDCPCGQTNFARKVECSKCGKPREGIIGAGRGGGRGIAATVGPLAPGPRPPPAGVVPGAHYAAPGVPAAGGPASRPDQRSGYGGGGGSGGYGRGGGGDSGGSRAPFMARDWTCASCLNVNWGKRDACHKCGIKKPAELGDRTGLGGGFLERQDRVSSRRAGDDGGGGSDDEYDDFGRKKKKYRAGGGTSAAAGAHASADSAGGGDRARDSADSRPDAGRYGYDDAAAGREGDRDGRRDRSRSRDRDRFGSRGGYGGDDYSRRDSDRTGAFGSDRLTGGDVAGGRGDFYRRPDDDRRDWGRR